MAEDRRLERGVRAFGTDWNAVRAAYGFRAARTAQQLRSRWRVLQSNNGRQSDAIC